MFCRNCGKEVAENAKVCLNCGSDPRGPGIFCFGCGTSVHESARSCVKCGADFRYGSGDRPTIVTIAGVFMLVGAGLNLLTALGLFSSIFIYAFYTFGLSFLCCFLPVINILCAIFEIIYGIKLFSENKIKNPFWIGIIEIITGILTMNILVLGFGIANLVMLLTKEAKEYFSK